MDEVTQIGDEKMLGRVATEWREVCRWEEPETPAFKVVDKPLEVDWQATAKYWEEQWRLEGTRAKDADFFMREAMDYQRAFTHALAAFEELAEEHRQIRTDYRMLEGLEPPCPGPGWYWVKGHWRSRTAPEARAGASPTGDKDIESGESQAKAGGQGEAFKGPWICLNCLATHDREYTYCPGCDGIVAPVLPQSGESSDLIHQGLEDCAEGRVSPVDLGEERSE